MGFGPTSEVNGLDWQCCLAGGSGTAPRILIFSIAMGADYSYEVKKIEIWAPAFYKHNNSFIATMTSLLLGFWIVKLIIWKVAISEISYSQNTTISFSKNLTNLCTIIYQNCFISNRFFLAKRFFNHKIQDSRFWKQRFLYYKWPYLPQHISNFKFSHALERDQHLLIGSLNWDCFSLSHWSLNKGAKLQPWALSLYVGDLTSFLEIESMWYMYFLRLRHL